MSPFLPIAQVKLPEIVPDFLTHWLGVLILIGGLVLMVMTIAEKVRAKSPAKADIVNDPLRTQNVPELATKAELVAGLSELEKDITQLRHEAAERETRRNGEIVKLHDRINLVAENTSSIRGRLDEIALSLHEMVRRGLNGTH